MDAKFSSEDLGKLAEDMTLQNPQIKEFTSFLESQNFKSEGARNGYIRFSPNFRVFNDDVAFEVDGKRWPALAEIGVSTKGDGSWLVATQHSRGGNRAVKRQGFDVLKELFNRAKFVPFHTQDYDAWVAAGRPESR